MSAQTYRATRTIRLFSNLRVLHRLLITHKAVLFTPECIYPLRDSARMTAFPPLSAIASQVTIQNGQLQIPEFKEHAQGAGPHPWVDGNEILLDTARISSRDTTPKHVAGGFRVTDALWSSPIGASFVQLQADRYRVRVERMLVKEILEKIQPAANANPESIGLTGQADV